MKKNIAILLAVVMILILCIGCNGKATTATPTTTTAPTEVIVEAASELENVTIKVGHTLSATHPLQIALEQMANECLEKSGGKIVIDIYPNSVLGSELSMIEQVMDGSLNAHCQTGLATFANFNTLANIENMPFLWKTEEAARQAVDNEFGALFAKEVMEPLGFHVVCFIENGYRHITNNTRAIVEPEDLKGLKIRVAEIPLRVQMFESLGASAIPMGFNELFSALQQGTVDGQENPLSNIASNNFDEVQKYLSLSGHLFNTGLFYINQVFWDSLQPEAQDIITEAATMMRDKERELLTDMNISLSYDLAARGMEINEVNKQAFIDALQPMYQEYIEANGDMGAQFVEMATKYN